MDYLKFSNYIVYFVYRTSKYFTENLKILWTLTENIIEVFKIKCIEHWAEEYQWKRDAMCNEIY